MLKTQEIQIYDLETQVLKQEITKGDLQYFWVFWEKNKLVFFQICLKYSKGNIHEAEDSLSEAMIRAVEVLPKHIQSIVNVRFWTIRFINNHCIDHYRKNIRYKFKEDSFNSINDEGFFFIQDQTNPELEIISKGDWKFIQELLEKIPEKLRIVFVYRYYEEMPYEKISELLSLSPACIRKRIQRAKEQLQRLMVIKQMEASCRMQEGHTFVDLH